MSKEQAHHKMQDRLSFLPILPSRTHLCSVFVLPSQTSWTFLRTESDHRYPLVLISLHKGSLSPILYFSQHSHCLHCDNHRYSQILSTSLLFLFPLTPSPVLLASMGLCFTFQIPISFPLWIQLPITQVFLSLLMCAQHGAGLFPDICLFLWASSFLALPFPNGRLGKSFPSNSYKLQNPISPPS